MILAPLEGSSAGPGQTDDWRDEPGQEDVGLSALDRVSWLDAECLALHVVADGLLIFSSNPMPSALISQVLNELSATS